MNRFCFWGIAGIALSFLAGCASSERMARISGGVVEEYSAPAKYRIRSEKFQAVNRKFGTPERAAKSGIPDFDKPLVNLWPFYFRSDQYFSALWPMIDYDPYGMAVRPFYNQEGDEYSVLFPLSAWNPESRAGWILNAVWAPGKFLFLPFAGMWDLPEESGGFAAPLAWWERDLLPVGWDDQKNLLRRRSDDTTVVLPWYSNRIRMIDPGEYDWLYRWQSESWHKEMCYRLSRKNQPIPKNKAEIRAFQKRIAETLPVREWNDYGIFPLFDKTHSLAGDTTLTIPLLLSQYEREGEAVSLDVLLSLLGHYQLDPKTGEKTVRILNFYYSKDRDYDLGRDGKIARELCRNADPGKRKTALRLLKQLDPALQLPDTVVDGNTMELFLKETIGKRNYPVRESVSYGFFPLFFGEYDDDNGMWACLALLSWGSWNQNSSFWAALPFLSMQSNGKYSGWTTILTPLAYWNKYHQAMKPEECRIASPESLYPDDTVSATDTYAGCGLFYRGKVQFYAGKDPETWKIANDVQRTLMRLAWTQKGLTRRRTHLDREWQKLREWNPVKGDRVDAARRNLRREELRVQENTWKKENQTLLSDFRKLQKLAGSLKNPLSRKELTDDAAREKYLKRLLQKHAILREKEDIGTGILFRRENFWNGDYHWRLFWGLAGANKKGDCETEHILHFLYRKRVEKDRSEIIFFPFVSLQQDGARQRVSFLGRIWQRTVGEKTGPYGYCCFIPFGTHPEQ